MGRQKRAYQSVTIRDVAERAGVAVSTVSRVLNGLDRVSEETRRRVEQAARELSYVPNNFAASMVTGQSKILGIIVPNFTHDFFGFIAQTAEHVFRKHGYLTIVSASGEDPVADPAAFLQRFYHMLDGVLLVPTAARLKDLESFDKPLLLVDRDMPGSSFSSISFDNEPACYELTRRLTEKGHRRIAALTADPDDSSISQLRYSGYARALRELGIPPEEEDVICADDFTVESGCRAMRERLKRPADFTAVFAIADDMAIGAMRALRESGRSIPEDCSIIAIDGINVSEYIHPMLTTLCQPMTAMGTKSVELLLGVIRGGAHDHLTLPTTLRAGESVRDLTK